MCGFGYIYHRDEPNIPVELDHPGSDQLEQSIEKSSEIIFSEESRNCCVGIVDIINSTRSTAKLVNGKLCKYYSIFLNTMSEIVKDFGGTVIKNIGDSLLYHFPETSSIDNKVAFMDVLECCFEMIMSHTTLNQKLYNESLPDVNYRVSADYGNILIGKSNSSIDIFGPTVNLCSKINKFAKPNGIVIGGDLYLNAKDLDGYDFSFVTTYSSGLKLEYPVYSVTRSAKKWF